MRMAARSLSDASLILRKLARVHEPGGSAERVGNMKAVARLHSEQRLGGNWDNFRIVGYTAKMHDALCASSVFTLPLLILPFLLALSCSRR